MSITATRPLTVAEARSLGQDVDREADYFGAQRVRMILDRLHADALAEDENLQLVLTFASYPVTILGPGEDAQQRFVRVLPTGEPSLRTGLPVANPDKVRHVRADLIKVRPSN